MAFEIVWTKRAIQGYSQIIDYFEEHWTEKEIRQFVKQCQDFFELLRRYDIFPQGALKNNQGLYSGWLDKSGYGSDP